MRNNKLTKAITILIGVLLTTSPVVAQIVQKLSIHFKTDEFVLSENSQKALIL